MSDKRTGFINPDWEPKIEFKDRNQNDYVLCSSCGSKYFEEVRVSKFIKTHYLLVGQAVPTASAQVFMLLRCIKCNKLHEPNLQLGGNDSQAKLYDEFSKEVGDQVGSVNDPPPAPPKP